MNAIILAGGRGSRLAPWIAPKCLMPVNGVTILQRILKHLLVTSWEFVDRAVVCTGYRAENVEVSVREHGWRTDKVVFSFAGEDVSMGARLIAARETAKSSRVLVCYGDELVDVNVRELVRKHDSAAMTFASAVAKVPGGTVARANASANPIIIEDRQFDQNIGFVIVEERCWEFLRPGDGLSTWINRVSKTERVEVHQHKGSRATINSLADLKYAEEVWK